MICSTCGNDHSVHGDCGFDTQFSREAQYFSSPFDNDSKQEDTSDDGYELTYQRTKDNGETIYIVREKSSDTYYVGYDVYEFLNGQMPEYDYDEAESLEEAKKILEDKYFCV